MVLHTRPKRQQETRGPSKAAQAAEKAHMVLRRYYGGGVAAVLRRCGGSVVAAWRWLYGGVMTVLRHATVVSGSSTILSGKKSAKPALVDR